MLFLVFLKVPRDSLDLKYIFAMPLSIKLSLDKFYYFFLFGPNPNLLFTKSIEFGLSLCYFFPLLVDVGNPGVWVFAPDVQNRNTNIFAQVIESLLLEQCRLALIALTVIVI